MKHNTKKMVLVAILAALTAIGGLIRIPIPPATFTLQLFFVILSGMLLGPIPGLISQLIYIFIGLAGIPVFAEGGGIQYIFHHTFGFILAMPITALITGILARKPTGKKIGISQYIVSSLIGVICCYVIGVPYLYLILNYVSETSFSISQAFIYGFLVYLPGDLIKIFAASYIAFKVCPNIGRYI